MKKKILLIVYIFIITLVIFSKEVYGYLDPSAMTYLIQVTAALFITLGTGIGILFYKLKKFMKNKHKKNMKIENKEEKIDE